MNDQLDNNQRKMHNGLDIELTIIVTDINNGCQIYAVPDLLRDHHLPRPNLKRDCSDLDGTDFLFSDSEILLWTCAYFPTTKVFNRKSVSIRIHDFLVCNYRNV